LLKRSSLVENSGESYLSPVITKETVEFLPRTDTEVRSENALSSRQREVVQLMREKK